MNYKFSVGGLVVSFLLTTLIVGQACAQAVPFYAEGFGSYTPADGTFVAPGVGTRLGRYVSEGGIIVTPTDDLLVSHFESDENNTVGIATGSSAGDVFITRFENGTVTLQPTGNPDEFTAVWEADAVVVSGEGEFENVRPCRKPLRVRAENAPFKLTDESWQFKWTLEGKIDLGRGRKFRRKPLRILGGGLVDALPSPGSTSNWEASGVGTHLGRYSTPGLDSSKANTVKLDVDVPFLLGFEDGPFVAFSGTGTFIASDRSRLAMEFEGYIEVMPEDGTIRWVADFIPVVEDCTRRFRRVKGGSIVMLAMSPLELENVEFTWYGNGDLVYRKKSRRFRWFR